MSFDVDTGIKMAGFALSLAAIIYSWFSGRKKDVDERFKEGSKRMDRQESRIAALEQAVKTLPGKDAFHSVQLEMVKQTGSLNEMRAVMEGNAKIMLRLETIVSRHEDHLLDGGKNK